MKPLETMTEYELLLYAHYFVLERWLDESERLNQHPDNAIAKIRFEEWDKRYNELHARLRELERSQQN